MNFLIRPQYYLAFFSDSLSLLFFVSIFDVFPPIMSSPHLPPHFHSSSSLLPGIFFQFLVLLTWLSPNFISFIFGYKKSILFFSVFYFFPYTLNLCIKLEVSWSLLIPRENHNEVLYLFENTSVTIIDFMQRHTMTTLAI